MNIYLPIFALEIVPQNIKTLKIMKVKVQNIQIQMSSAEVGMLCSALCKIDWKNFHPESSVTESYKEFVTSFVKLVESYDYK